MPLLKIIFPSEPPLPWNSGSNLVSCTISLCGNTPSANGRTAKEVVKMRPRLTGRINLGLLFNHCVFCNLNSASAGITIIGEEFITLDAAVSPTAIVAAFLDFPSDASDRPASLSSSVSTGWTSIPLLISSPLMRHTFNTPADATAANGTNLPSKIRVLGETPLRRGTKALRPTATEEAAPTARK